MIHENAKTLQQGFVAVARKRGSADIRKRKRGNSGPSNF